jgi:TetR/AcrR family transcriptional regulator
MSKPNLLYYFVRKDDVYVAVLEHTLTDWLEPLKQLDAKGDPAEEIRSYIKHKIEISRPAPSSSQLFTIKFCKARHGSNQSWKDR